MVADDFNAWVLSLKNILQRKGKLVSVTCSGQAEGITKRGVFELFPLKGRVKWCWQPRCWDTAPSVFFCGVAAPRRPSPATPWRMLHKDRLSSRTCLEEAEIKAKRERIGKRRNRCEIGPVFQQWYWPCSHPVGFGELLCEKWSVPRGERKIFPPGLWCWKKKSTKSCELGGNGLEKTVGSKARTVL